MWHPGHPPWEMHLPRTDPREFLPLCCSWRCAKVSLILFPQAGLRRRRETGMKPQTWTYREAQIHDFRSFLAIKAMDLLVFQGVTNNPAFTKVP